jgi:hypothetical protein
MQRYKNEHLVLGFILVAKNRGKHQYIAGVLGLVMA